MRLKPSEAIDIVDGAIHAMLNMGEFGIDADSFAQLDPKIMVFDETNIDEHVRMQAAGLAYYAQVKTEVDDILVRLEKKYARWRKVEHRKANNTVMQRMGNKKPNIIDVEAEMLSTKGDEIKAWEDKIQKWKKRSEAMENLLNAWKQKSFAMNKFVDMQTEEYFQTDSIQKKPMHGKKKRDMRGAIDSVRSRMKGSKGKAEE